MTSIIFNFRYVMAPEVLQEYDLALQEPPTHWQGTWFEVEIDIDCG